MSIQSKAFGRHHKRLEFRGDGDRIPWYEHERESYARLLGRKETYQTIKDVYSTDMAITTVTIRPGTNPKTE